MTTAWADAPEAQDHTIVPDWCRDTVPALPVSGPFPAGSLSCWAVSVSGENIPGTMTAQPERRSGVGEAILVPEGSEDPSFGAERNYFRNRPLSLIYQRNLAP